MKLYSRKCSITGKGMDEGFCFGDGETYIQNEDDALKKLISLGYDTLNDAYNNGAYYWTDWYDEDLKDDGEAYDAKGNLYNFINEQWVKS